ncbi:hypothetical protein ACS0PU_009752 [Formica fusca]
MAAAKIGRKRLTWKVFGRKLIIITGRPKFMMDNARPTGNARSMSNSRPKSMSICRGLHVISLHAAVRFAEQGATNILLNISMILITCQLAYCHYINNFIL